jgi:hypothetical protein
MKESRFLELLNLYVDQQIEPRDAELLEQEILRDPARHRTYVQYCRMHRACTMLYEEAMKGEVSVRHSFEDAHEPAIATSRSWNPFLAATGFAAVAAALVALAFLRVGPASSNSVASSPVIAIEEPVEIAVNEGGVQLPMPNLGDFRFMLVRRNADDGASSQAVPLPAELAWMNFQISPLAAAPARQPLLFERVASGREELNVLTSPYPPEAATETIGFQFQK